MGVGTTLLWLVERCSRQ